jgi:hypothetical protein
MPKQHQNHHFRQANCSNALPDPIHLTPFKPTFQDVQISPAKSKLPTWQASSRPNPAFKKNQKKTLFKSDTTGSSVLRLSSLLHIGDHFTVFRTEAVVFVTHSQFVVKPGWTNPRL